MPYRFLSYEFSELLPVFGEQEEFCVRQIRSISSGDSSNAFSAELQSHWGTHIDAPHHFFTNGNAIGTYPATDLVFTAPRVLETSLQPSEILHSSKVIADVCKDCDLLLIKSGWWQLRGEPVYCQENPGIAPEFALQLRTQFPLLRAVGVDWISISAFRHRELGRDAHRAFLDPAGVNNSLLLVEDMDLSTDLVGLKRVIVAPLRIKKFDSAPCTVLGEWDD